MTDQNIDGSRKWSVSRILAASLLCLILALAIAFGIDRLIAPNATTKVSKVHQSQSVIKRPPKSFFNSAPTTNSATNPATKPSQSASSSGQNNQPASGSSQLTNTGPGDVAVYGFLIATPLGALVYNLWLKRRLNR